MKLPPMPRMAASRGASWGRRRWAACRGTWGELLVEAAVIAAVALVLWWLGVFSYTPDTETCPDVGPGR
jgi:hypothetical protein